MQMGFAEDMRRSPHAQSPMAAYAVHTSRAPYDARHFGDHHGAPTPNSDLA